MAVVASNTASGTTFELNNVKLDGGLYVGPGGDTGAQVVKAGTTSVGSEGILAKSIDIDDVEVPGGDDGDEGDPQIPTLGTFKFLSVDGNDVWSLSDGAGIDFRMGPRPAGTPAGQYPHVSSSWPVVQGTEVLGGVTVTYFSITTAPGIRQSDG